MLEDLINMPPLLRFLAIVFLLACVLGALSWLAIVAYSIRLPFHAKSGSLHGWLRFNPFNVVFFKDKLTPKGLVLRRRLLISVGCFVGFWGLGMVAGLLAKSVAQT